MFLTIAAFACRFVSDTNNAVFAGHTILASASQNPLNLSVPSPRILSSMMIANGSTGGSAAARLTKYDTRPRRNKQHADIATSVLRKWAGAVSDTNATCFLVSEI